MAAATPTLIDRLRRAARPREAADAAALARYVRSGDPDAFAHLVRRFGPMVAGVCRRALGDTPDADDAFQATFLVLVRKARTVRPPAAVGSWLFAVAHRTAARVRATARRQAVVLRPLDDRPAAEPPEPSDLAVALDAELAALPDRYRDAVVLCELDGLTIKAAAAAVGAPVGTLASRLARGRRVLADRLRAKGFGAPAAAVSGLLAAMATPTTAAAFDPAAPTAAASRLARKVTAMALLAKLRLTTALAFLAAAAGALALGLLPGPTAAPVARAAPVPKDDGRLTAERTREFDELFARLGRSGPEGTRATLAFVARPATAVAYLKRRLRPLKLTEEEAKGLLAKLFGDKEEDVAAARRELAELDPRLALPVADLWAEAKTDEHRQRLAAVLMGELDGHYLCTFELRLPKEQDYPANFLVRAKPGVLATAFQSGRLPNVAVGCARDLRQMKGDGRWGSHASAAAVLEHIGTPEAVGVIEAMATGHPDAGPTVAAKEALARLKAGDGKK